LLHLRVDLRTYGAKAAACHHFHKSARSLSRKETALIIAILPNPRQWNAPNPSAYVSRRADNIVRYLDSYELPD